MSTRSQLLGIAAVSLFVHVAVTAPAVHAQSATAQAGPPLAGRWIGVYQVYPYYVQMTLTVASEPGTDGVAPAEIRVEGLEGGNAPHMGVGEGTIRYQPSVRSLDITAAATNLRGLRFHAVYDAERRVFAGYRIGASSDASPYLVMVRQGQEGRLFDRIKDMPDGARARGSFGLGSSPSSDVLRNWASQFLKEYPNIDPYRTESGALYLMARNLFRDEYFRSFFGKTYDELSNRDLSRINSRLEEMPPPRANFPEERANGAARSFARGFWVNVGTFAAPDILLSVVAMRSISAWRNQTLKRLGGIAPETGVFGTLAAIEAEEGGVLGTFWPSEREAFVDALDGHRARLAEPVLVASVQEQVAAAASFEDVSRLHQTLSLLTRPPAGPPRAPASSRRGSTGRGHATLAPPAPAASVGGDLSTLSSMAGESVRAQLRTIVEQAISTLVGAEARRDESRLAASSAGTHGSRLEEGVKLSRQLQTKYASYSNEPAVQSVFESLGRQRRTLLLGAQPELELRIRQAATEPALDDVVSRFLSVPSDRSDAVGARLIAAVEAKKGQLRLARQQAESARQQAEAAKQRVLAQRAADAAARRRALSDTYGSYLPTLDDLYNVLRLVPTIAERTATADQNRFVSAAQQIGFYLPADRKIYADTNRFRNSRGAELITWRVQSADGSFIYTAELRFENADRRLVELYDAELKAGYREMRKSTVDLSDTTGQIVAESPPYIKTGGTIYSYSIEDGTFTMQAMLNNSATGAAIVAERLSRDTIRVSSHARTTDVAVRRGDRVHLTASGSVTLGPFVGGTGPAGVDGFENYRIDGRFRLGSLLGRIGDGAWFLVGPETTITAPEDGGLDLLINDNDRGNNDGAFDVRYSVEASNR